MFSETVTDSGLRIITEQMPAARSVSVGMWVCSGAVDEPHDRLGISHFTEHMLFKGTTTRAAANISETIDAIGGYLDAFTDREYVCCHAKVLAEHAPLAIELLGDMLTHSRLNPRDIAIEKGVVTEEILSCEDTPEEYLIDRFTETIWEKSPLGRRILGSVETVEQFNRRIVREFMCQSYTPQNMLVAAAGNLNHTSIVKSVERSLRDLTPSAPSSHDGSRRQAGEPVAAHAHKLLIDKDTERLYLCVGAGSFGQLSQKKYAASLLDMVLAGGCSSRLFQQIREKRGLVYSIGSSSACYLSAGFLAVAASCSLDKAARVVELIGTELRSLRRKGITHEELRRAQRQAKGNLLLASESTTDRMMRNAQNQIYFNRQISVEDIISTVEAVTLDDVNQVANDVFTNTRLNLVAVGPMNRNGLDLHLSVE